MQEQERPAERLKNCLLGVWDEICTSILSDWKVQGVRDEQEERKGGQRGEQSG